MQRNPAKEPSGTQLWCWVYWIVSFALIGNTYEDLLFWAGRDLFKFMGLVRCNVLLIRNMKSKEDSQNFFMN